MARRRRRRVDRGPLVGPRTQVWLWVAAATIVAGLLRLYALGQWSFWIDEAHTYRDATMPLDGELGFWSSDRAFYPLTFLGLRALIDAAWLGSGEGWLRLPFALVGVITVPVMWLAGRRLVGDGAAVFSAWLLALMPWHLFWSQNARGYVFVVLSSAVAAGLLWRWAEEGRRRFFVLAFGAIGVGALFHPTAALQAVGLLAFVVLRRMRHGRLRHIFGVLLLAAALLALMPWLIGTLSPIQGFLKTKTDTSVLHLLTTVGFYFRPMLLIAALAGFALLYHNRERDRALLLVCLTFIPLAVLAVLGGSLAKTTARYGICALPAMLWLAAAGARQLWALCESDRRVGARLLAAVLGAALCLDFLAASLGYYTSRHGDRARWREACTWLEREFDGEPVYALTFNQPSVAYYLTPDIWQNGGTSERPYAVELLADWKADGKGAEGRVHHEPGWANHLEWQRERAMRRGSSLVVLVTRPELEEVDQDGQLWQTLREDFELALYLPCWVGPKDESIWAFVPAGS